MGADWPHLLEGGLFTALLAVAAVYDARKQIIPDRICFGIALTGLLRFTPEKAAGLMVAALLLLVAKIGGGLFGGDIKFTAAVGLVLGFHRCMTGVMLGLTAMVVFHIIYTLIQNERGGDMKKSYPLAPFLSLGCLTAYYIF